MQHKKQKNQSVAKATAEASQIKWEAKLTQTIEDYFTLWTGEDDSDEAKVLFSRFNLKWKTLAANNNHKTISAHKNKEINPALVIIPVDYFEMRVNELKQQHAIPLNTLNAAESIHAFFAWLALKGDTGLFDRNYIPNLIPLFSRENKLPLLRDNFMNIVVLPEINQEQQKARMVALPKNAE